MRAGTVLVLVAFITLGMEMACARKHLFRGQQRPGVCPRTPKGLASGLCLQRCVSDESCPEGMKCCPNMCGHVCKYPILKEGGPGGHVKDGVDVY